MSTGFRKVGVVGLGTMGAGIVEVLARGEFDVVGIEINDEALARGRAHLEGSTGRAVKRGKLTVEGQRAILDRVTLSTGFADLGDRDLVIEAVPERLDLKRRVFEQLDQVCGPDAVLATNTSSLSVTEIAVGTNRPTTIVGVHFFNPAPVMKLVEVISTVLTDPSATERVTGLVRGLGKTPVAITDRAGFVANRLLLPYLNQAVAMYDGGHASREDIDAAMKLGTGLPMGPLTLSDMIGLDILLEAMEAIYAETRDLRHAPAPALRHLVTASLLGRKTGRGFYRYDKPGSATVVDAAATTAATATTATTAATATTATPAATATTAATAATATTAATAATATAAGPGGAAVTRLGVVGSGVVARDLIARAATAGLTVVFVAGDESKATDVTQALDAESAARVTGGTDLADLAGCDLVVEAVADEVAVKRSLLAALDDVVAGGAVIATTGTAVPVIELAVAAERPESVVGLHLPETGENARIAEIAGTALSTADALDRVTALAERIGLQPVRSRDRVGYIVDALRFPYLNDAARMLESGYADADSIDAAMRLGCGYPSGPIADLDRLGLDRAVGTLRAIFTETRQSASAPAPVLAAHHTAGRPLR